MAVTVLSAVGPSVYLASLCNSVCAAACSVDQVGRGTRQPAALIATFALDISVVVFVFVFEDRVMLCSPGCPGISSDPLAFWVRSQHMLP